MNTNSLTAESQSDPIPSSPLFQVEITNMTNASYRASSHACQCSGSLREKLNDEPVTDFATGLSALKNFLCQFEGEKGVVEGIGELLRKEFSFKPYVLPLFFEKICSELKLHL